MSDVLYWIGFGTCMLVGGLMNLPAALLAEPDADRSGWALFGKFVLAVAGLYLIIAVIAHRIGTP